MPNYYIDYKLSIHLNDQFLLPHIHNSSIHPASSVMIFLPTNLYNHPPYFYKTRDTHQPANYFHWKLLPYNQGNCLFEPSTSLMQLQPESKHSGRVPGAPGKANRVQTADGLRKQS